MMWKTAHVNFLFYLESITVCLLVTVSAITITDIFYFSWVSIYNILGWSYSLEISLLVFIRNQSISAGLEPVLDQNKKSCIASYLKQFSTNIRMKII